MYIVYQSIRRKKILKKCGLRMWCMIKPMGYRVVHLILLTILRAKKNSFYNLRI